VLLLTGGHLPRPAAQVQQCLVAALARKKGSWRTAALVALGKALGAVPGDSWALASGPLLDACERHCQVRRTRRARLRAWKRRSWLCIVLCWQGCWAPVQQAPPARLTMCRC
jgi:hypothetical protein